MIDLGALMAIASKREASDLHIQAGEQPWLRVDGALQPLGRLEPISAEELEDLLQRVLDDGQLSRLESNGDVDLAAQDTEGVPWRITCFRQHTGPALSLRRLASRIPSLLDLGLPPTLEQLAHMKSGLVLLTGAAGSGKSTTLAALIDVINTQSARHIITLEDPIEYVFHNKRSVVHQRAVGAHVESYARGLQDALVEGPDVLIMGDARDRAAVQLGLEAAETGMLVFTTVHTIDAPQAIDRLIDLFPHDERNQVQEILAQCLRAVVSQVLLPKKRGRGRVAACELLFATPAIASLIREGKTYELESQLQTGRKHGSKSLDDSLEELLQAGTIHANDAYQLARNRTRFERYRPSETKNSSRS